MAAFFTFTRAKSSGVSPYRAILRRAYSAKYAGLVAPSTRKRSQSGSSGRSPPAGAKNPLGVESAPTTRTTSASPARIWARAAPIAWAPEAQAAYTLVTRAPCHPRAWAKVAPATYPGYPHRMVSAPTTEPTSVHSRPASASAARAAAVP